MVVVRKKGPKTESAEVKSIKAEKVEVKKSPIKQKKTKAAKAKKNLVLAPSPDNGIEKKGKNPKIKKAPQTQEDIIEEDPKTEYDNEELRELEEKYKINAENLKTAIEGVIKFRKENPKLQKELFNERFRLSIIVHTIKVPETHNRIARLMLKHPLYDENAEICLLTADVKAIPNKHHEKHQEYYEKMLAEAGVTNINRIMTFHELRSEYETFESKKKLAYQYDLFLCEGKINGRVIRRIGNVFYWAKNVPNPVDLSNPNKIKKIMDAAVRKTQLYLHKRGDTFQISFGHSNMPIEHLVENLFYVLKGVDQEFPGGFSNLKAIKVAAHKALSIPIYESLKIKNKVSAASKSKELKKKEAVTGELSTRLNTHVKVEADGTVTTFKPEDNEGDEDEEEDTDAEDMEQEDDEDAEQEDDEDAEQEDDEDVEQEEDEDKEDEEENDDDDEIETGSNDEENSDQEEDSEPEEQPIARKVQQAPVRKNLKKKSPAKKQSGPPQKKKKGN